MVHDFASDQLLALLERVLKAPRTTAEEECMVLLCTTLAGRAHDSKVFSAITHHAKQLYERKQDWSDLLLASWAEKMLPSGFIAAHKASPFRINRNALRNATPVLHSLASVITKTGIRSTGIARLLAVAIYRSPDAWQEYSALPPTLEQSPDTSSACLAYLEVAFSSKIAQPSSIALQAMLTSAAETLSGTGVDNAHPRARDIILSIIAVDKTLASGILSKLQGHFGQDTLSHPGRLTGANVSFLAKLHAEVASFESFAVLEACFNASLLWIVRRFAEDEENDIATAQLVSEICKSRREARNLRYPILMSWWSR